MAVSVKGPFSNLSPTRDRRGLGVLQPPSGEVSYYLPGIFGLRTSCPSGLIKEYRTQLETVQGTAGRIPLQSVWTVPRDNKVTINQARSLGPAVEGFLFDLNRYL